MRGTEGTKVHTLRRSCTGRASRSNETPRARVSFVFPSTEYVRLCSERRHGERRDLRARLNLNMMIKRKSASRLILMFHYLKPV